MTLIIKPVMYNVLIACAVIGMNWRRENGLQWSNNVQIRHGLK